MQWVCMDDTVNGLYAGTDDTVNAALWVFGPPRLSGVNGDWQGNSYPHHWHSRSHNNSTKYNGALILKHYNWLLLTLHWRFWIADFQQPFCFFNVRSMASSSWLESSLLRIVSAYSKARDSIHRSNPGAHSTIHRTHNQWITRTCAIESDEFWDPRVELGLSIRNDCQNPQSCAYQYFRGYSASTFPSTPK